MIDGGPAFPFSREWENERKGYTERETYDGMSLRDYFAAAALTGILAHVNGFEPGSGTVSRLAYAYADAMIAEGAK